MVREVVGRFGAVDGCSDLFYSSASFAAWSEAQRSLRWVVYAEVATRHGELANALDASNALKYLARYASGASLRNGRLIEIVGDKIRFSYKDCRAGGKEEREPLAPPSVAERTTPMPKTRSTRSTRIQKTR